MGLQVPFDGLGFRVLGVLGCDVVGVLVMKV